MDFIAFPLLENSRPAVEFIDADLVRARLLWLDDAEAAAESDWFALRVMPAEPVIDSFYQTHTLLLALEQPKILAAWLEQEKAVCERKINVNRTEIPKLMDHYKIATLRKQEDGSFSFRFPHGYMWDKADDSNVCHKFAQQGFPLADDTTQYAELSISLDEAREIYDMVTAGTTKRRKKE